MPGNLNSQRLWFLRGALAAFASSGQVVTADEIRRLCALPPDQVSGYLGAARDGQHEDEPDFCSVVGGEASAAAAASSGKGWPSQLRNAHQYWRDRRHMEDAEFEREWLALPTFPAGARRG